MSGSSGSSGSLSDATNAVQTVLKTLFGSGPTTTSGSSNTQTAATGNAWSDNSSWGTTVTNGFNAGWDNKNTITSGVTTSKSTADPGAIAMLRALATTAIGNSENPDATTGLLKGILQTAGDAMTKVFGQQSQAGLYNSSATAAQNNDILSRAGADAASAILGYKTNEQSIASGALDSILKATGQTTTNTYSDTASADNTGQITSAVAGTISDNKQNSSNVTVGESATQSSSKTQQKGLLNSVVCTWMFKHGFLSRQRYFVVITDFRTKPLHHQLGYIYTVAPLVRELNRDRTSLISRAVLWLFTHRTEYVCALHELPGCSRTWKGLISRAIVAAACTPLGLKHMADLALHPQDKEEVNA